MSTSQETAASGLTAEVEADAERERARKRLQDRRDFGSHVVAYVVVNMFVVTAWVFTGGGYFWSMWLIALWGVGLVLHGWETFIRRPVTDADVDAELRRQGR